MAATNDADDPKYVYAFGGGEADGDGSMANLLGGKGANLAEMAGHPTLRLPVPPGFTITTDVCTHYYANDHTYPEGLEAQVDTALAKVEELTGKRFGDPDNPLLVSVRSGARRSMPGMMETVLDIGLTEATIPGLIARSGSERFVYDAYRRLITMYADVVMEKAAGIEPKEGRGIRRLLEDVLDQQKHRRGVTDDTDLTADDLRELVDFYKRTVEVVLGTPFPDDARTQLWGGIGAVFSSWMGRRAVEYRRIEHIPDVWGTAVNVQAMVFGNLGDDCATGVAFSRNPGNGENQFYGEFLVNAQGEDVVAGTRTPAPINEYSKNAQSEQLPTLERTMPGLYRELDDYRLRLEQHYRDMQDIEFTIEQGRLYVLQCRVGKRNGLAAVRMAAEMHADGLIDGETAIRRVAPGQLVELLLPMLDPRAEQAATPIATGLPAGPGGARGRVVFSSHDAVRWADRGETVILVRDETSPEDVDGMHRAEAILTSKGGMTSHAALVARGWGKCCVVGCSEVQIADDHASFTTPSGVTVRRGDWISLNGTKGAVYEGILPLVDVDPERNEHYKTLMSLVDEVRTLKVRTNADTPHDIAQAVRFGAEGIGLFRTEHMFYGEGSGLPLFLLRKVILSHTVSERRAALDELFPYVRDDIRAALETLDGRPVTVRLLDPPLHEFVPREDDKLSLLATDLRLDLREVRRRADALREANPMLGHRGVRLGVTYPEITEMQIRAILEAAAGLVLEGRDPHPEIMVPVTVTRQELDHQRALVDRVHAAVCADTGLESVPFLFGTMIEIPRAAIRAGHLAETAEFFSFGTNDLTQMTFGFSRDDVGTFLPDYLQAGLLEDDPFQTLDINGVGELIRLAIERGRATRPDLHVGICGEHGGDPDSVKLCQALGMDYVSCSPFRVPIARLAAAHAAIEARDARS